MRPITTGSSAFDSWKRSDRTAEYIDTTCLLRFGTSMPIVPRPGIGAMMRMPDSALRLWAMSFWRPCILAILTPCFCTISYSVTVGPTVALIRWIGMPKFRSVSSIRVLFSKISSSETSESET